MFQVNQVIDVDSDKNINMDRMTLYCIPVPGETNWVKKISFKHEQGFTDPWFLAQLYWNQKLRYCHEPGVIGTGVGLTNFNLRHIICVITEDIY